MKYPLSKLRSVNILDYQINVYVIKWQGFTIYFNRLVSRPYNVLLRDFLFEEDTK